MISSDQMKFHTNCNRFCFTAFFVWVCASLCRVFGVSFGVLFYLFIHSFILEVFPRQLSMCRSQSWPPALILSPPPPHFFVAAPLYHFVSYFIPLAEHTLSLARVSADFFYSTCASPFGQWTERIFVSPSHNWCKFFLCCCLYSIWKRDGYIAYDGKCEIQWGIQQ